MSQVENPSHARFLGSEEHPDVSFCRDDTIGPVLSAALSATYAAQPRNPVHFLGSWLMQHANATKGKQELTQSFETREQMLKAYQDSLDALHKADRQKEMDATAKEKFEADFLAVLQSSNALDDLLEYLANHIWNGVTCSGVYIGQIEKVKAPVTDKDDDTKHIDPEGKEVIHFLASSDNHTFMVDKTLSEEQGPITWSVWKDKEPEPNENDEDEDPYGQKPKQETEERLNATFVKNVIREATMYYFDVPKMGCFLAVPLNYKSCLNENSFDSGVMDLMDVNAKKQEQEEQKKAQEEMSAKQSNQDFYNEEEQFPEILQKPYDTREVRLVVCLDTLRMDKKVSDEERLYTERLVIKYRDNWQRSENESLHRDVHAYVKRKMADKEHKEDNEDKWVKAIDDAKDHVAKEADSSNWTEEEQAIENLKAELKILRERLMTEYFQEALREFKDYKVVKNLRVFQMAFYLFGIRNWQVVEKGTNKLDWKRANKYVNDNLFNYIENYHPCGAKSYKPPEYAMTKRLQLDISYLSEEKTDEYSLALGLLLKFIKVAVDLRIADVRERRVKYTIARKAREDAQAATEELAKKKVDFIEEARLRHQTEMETLEPGMDPWDFDVEGAKQEFEERESNHSVHIPNRVRKENDGDIDWEEPELPPAV